MRKFSHVDKLFKLVPLRATLIAKQHTLLNSNKLTQYLCGIIDVGFSVILGEIQYINFCEPELQNVRLTK